MTSKRTYLLQQITCTLVISSVILAGCDNKGAKDNHGHHGKHHGHDHHHDEAHHGHGHSHGHGHDHHHHHDELATVASQFGGITVSVGDVDETQLPPAYAEVVITPAHQISISLRPSRRKGSQSLERLGGESLDIVTAWVDAKILRSTIHTLHVEQEEGANPSGTRRYVGQLSEKYRDGGDMRLLAPIIRINGSRESFDVTLTIPSLDVGTPSSPEANAQEALEIRGHD